MTDGKWTCSTNEERWNCGEEFDTRDEAFAYAESAHAPEYGVDDGGSFWVGQIKAVTIDEIAAGILDSDSILDQMACWLHDNVGEDFVDDLVVTKPQGDDLETRLAAAVSEWAKAHGIAPTCFTLEHIERHTWERCNEGRTVPHAAHPDMDAVVERCVLPIEHEGACEWL